MEPLIRNLLWAFWHDEKAARRWIRGGLGALTVGGMGFAKEISEALNMPGLGKWIRVATILTGFTMLAMQSSAEPAPPPMPKP